MKNKYTSSKSFALLFILLQSFFFGLKAQDSSVINTPSSDVPAATPVIVEQQLENLTEGGDDVETEDDSYLQLMQQFLKEPLNLNTADESDLKELLIFTPLQIQNLILYRNLLGKFINIYELQAVPGWNISTIRKIRPYVSVSNNLSLFNSLGGRFRNGEHSLLARVTQVIEKSRGFNSDTTASSFYPGSPQKLLVRYKYIYKNLLQYGITAEKDAGEQFFKGKQNAGFDFYSAHFFARNLGFIKSLALGDFTVNLGQGLTQWQSLAFKKSSDVLNIKRQSDVIRPYNSSGEIFFNRGAGITVQSKSLEATAFVSYRKLDANFIAGDTLNNDDFVSSLQTSGYHRTSSEVADKNAQGQFTFGGNISLTQKQYHLGINAVHYNFKLPIDKAADLYNKYTISGKELGNYSIDYSYTYKNIHFFGEAATDNTFNKAFINGLLINTNERVDMSFVYRKISIAYKSLYTNAFTESTFPVNESGLYSGITIRPTDIWRIDAYVDIYNFPWLKYNVDAPTSGQDYLVQLTYKPNKQVEMYSRFRSERKAINYNPEEFILKPVIVKPRQSWRNQLSYKISQAFTVRSRVELLWYDKKGTSPGNGFLIYSDLLYKPLLKPFSANMRVQYFETDDYNSRLYAYENDVLYSFSIPVFYDKGYRYYINLNYDVSKRLSFWFRIAQTFYPDKNIIGSSLDEISGNRKTEIKIQSLINF